MRLLKIITGVPDYFLLKGEDLHSLVIVIKAEQFQIHITIKTLLVLFTIFAL